MSNIDINIETKRFSYPIIIDEFSELNLCNKIFEQLNSSKVLVIISDKVNKIWGKKLLLFTEQIEIYKYVMKDGEKYKNLRTYEKIMKFAQKCGLKRNDCILAIGGGVVGDMAGFVASTYMRGIKLIQIPTTLLACVDSSVGGKTGLDTDFGKNLIGSFYQPSAVIINVNFLDTLDERQYKSGLGECIKYAFIEKSCGNKEYYNLINFINENSDKIKSRDKKILINLIEMCVNLKKSVVEQDEHEDNLRKILNFGHTYGHALEKFGKYKKYTHGEAVVQGMFFAFELAYKLGLITENYKFSAFEVMSKLEFDKINLSSIKKLIPLMHLDKKNRNQNLTFILPKDYSEVIIKEIPDIEL